MQKNQMPELLSSLASFLFPLLCYFAPDARNPPSTGITMPVT